MINLKEVAIDSKVIKANASNRGYPVIRIFKIAIQYIVLSSLTIQWIVGMGL